MLELFFALMVGALALLLNRLSIPCQDKVCSYRLFGDVVAFSAGVWLYSTILLLLSRPYATLIICVFFERKNRIWSLRIPSSLIFMPASSAGF